MRYQKISSLLIVIIFLMLPAMAEAVESMIKAGRNVSIALHPDGTVWTWGYNGYGQIGDGTQINRPVPVQVSGLTNVISVDVGGNHTVVLKSDNTVWTWGSNGFGHLGDGTTTNRFTPIQVPGLTNVIAIAAGEHHTLALKADNTVWAWGLNSFGQLGDGTLTNRTSPVQVTGLTNVIAISAGDYHNLVLKSDQTVFGWGQNFSCQLGAGQCINRSSAVQVDGLTNVISIAAGGFHSLAVKSDHTLWSWGNNQYGQLGNTTVSVSSSPIQVLENIKAIAAGSDHTMALQENNTLWVFGKNDYGQLGDGTAINRTTPIQLPGLINITGIAAGTSHTLIVKSDKTIWAWGYNEFGQLGDGSINNNRSSPALVSGLSQVVAVATGYYHTLALKEDFTVWAWGQNDFGQVGDGSTLNRTSPVQLIGLSNVSALAAGELHSLALKSDNTVWAWGSNGNGQLGDGTTTTRSSPIQVPGLSSVVAISAGNTHSMALKSDQTVWTWGSNYAGKLGDGTTTDRSSPVQVPGLTNVMAIAAGDDHSLALKSDGTVWAWGSNSIGQLGDGTNTNQSSPIQVPGLTNVVAIVASYHSLALKTDGTVWGWGKNEFGQLGDGTFTNRSSPLQIPGLTNVTKLAVGRNHTLALKTDNTIWSMGINWFGQLGNGTMVDTIDNTTAKPIPGLTNVISLDAGRHHSVALKSDHTVWSWGLNISGQLGDLKFGLPRQVSNSLRSVPSISAIADQTIAQNSTTGLINFTIGDESIPLDNLIVTVVSSNTALIPADATHLTLGGSGANRTLTVKPVSNQVGIAVIGILVNNGTDTTTKSINVAVLPDGILNPSGGQVMVKAGEYHALALHTNGTVWSWGDNANGQLGIGTTVNQTIPQQIPGLDNLISVGAGAYHSLALKSDNTVWAWGGNSFGQLGDGTTTNRSTPVQVPGLTNVIAIVAGIDHSVVLKSDLTVWAWGNNFEGQLGDGTTTSRSLPVQVTGLTNVIAIAAGHSFTLALKADRTLWSWGDNSAGQLGDGTPYSKSSPIQALGLSDVIAIGAGYSHSVALTADHTVWTWGMNLSGQLGNGRTINTSLPDRISGLSDVSGLAAGWWHTVVIKSDTTVWTFGANNYGQLGDGTAIYQTAPVQVAGLNGVKTVTGGGYFTLAAKSDNSVWSWGQNYVGQLGDGTTTRRTTPLHVPILTNVIATVGGEGHTVVLKSDQTVWAWGKNNYGQLGDGTTLNRSSPVQVAGMTNVIAIATNKSSEGLYTLALKSDHTVWGWGYNSYGQLGDGTTINRSTPVQVAGLTNVIAMAAGPNHALVLKSDNTVWALGDNSSGQLGDGTSINRSSPVQVTGLSNIIAIATGREYSLALKSDNTVWAWGANTYGQLGDGTTTARSNPFQIPGLITIIAIDAGENHSIALKSDQTVMAWGRNGSGQLGDGTTTTRSSPVQVVGLNNVTSISAGYFHNLALKSDKTVWAWGDNSTGLLGDGTLLTRSSPVQVQGLPGNILSIGVGAWHSMAVQSDNTLWSWGGNSYGQLGDPNVWLPRVANISLTALPTISHIAHQSGKANATIGPIAFTVGDSKTPVANLVVTVNSSNTTLVPVDSAHLLLGGSGANRTLTITPATNQNGLAVITVTLSNGTDTTTKSFRVTVLPDIMTPSVSAAVQAVAIKAGNFHSVALFSDGTVWTWGDNDHGQLGDGTIIDRATPVKVPGLTNVVAIAARDNHTLALKADGTVWAWGNNEFGQLGDGTTTDRLTPVQVVLMSNITAIAAGGYHTLALKGDGTVWAWGNNLVGQLGDGTTAHRSSPVQVVGLTNIKSIAAGDYHSMVLKSDQTVWGWGNNLVGLLGWGDGTTTNRSSPGQVAGLYDVIAITAAGGQTLALKSDNTLWAWGTNYDGQLGDGSTTNRATPIQVASMTDVVAFESAGWGHTVALKADGTVWAWGDNFKGQLGDGTLVNRFSPVQVPGLTNVLAIAAGNDHTLILKSDHTIWAWGTNWSGQLGDGTNTIQSVPRLVAGLLNVTAMAAGAQYGVALLSDQTVWTWGSNWNGQLGDGTTTMRSSPGQVPGLTNVLSVATGGTFTLVLRENGTVWTWGSNFAGQLGDGTTIERHTPVQVPGMTNVTAMVAGGGHTLVLKSDGTVWAWGDNSYGQLGDGSTTHRSNPVQIPRLTNVIALAATGSYSVALKSDNTVWAWGLNSFGQLGDGTTTNRSSPVQVSGLTNVIAIAAGDRHTLAVKSDNTVWAWGINDSGELGDGTTTPRFSPVQVAGLTNVIDIAAGGTHSVALKTDRTLWAWGNNLHGELGDGTTLNRTTPVQVSGLTNISKIVSSSLFTLALKADNQTLLAWGDNQGYQLGFNPHIMSPKQTIISALPTLAAIANQSGNEDGMIGPISLTVGDVDTPLGNLVVTATSANTALIPADNTHLILGGTGANRTLTIQPALNQIGSALITVTVSDQATAVSQSFTLTVTSMNDPPTIGGLTPIKATPGQLYSFTPVANDVDGDPLIFSITNKPPWASFNTANGTLSGTPTEADYGIYNAVVISVSSGQDTVALPAFVISVEDISNPVAIDILDGIFKTAQNVMLTCQDVGSGCAAIYYTLDGSTPTVNSILYTDPISLTASTQLRYIAIDHTGRMSAVRTKNFMIDSTPPLVFITDPLDGASLTGLNWITGTASDDTGSGIASIKIQLTDGSGYLDNRPDLGLGLYPASLYANTQLPWVTIAAQDYANWMFFPPNIWKIGSTYSLAVRVEDKAGNITDKSILFAISLDGGKAYTTLNIELSSQAILQGKSLDVSGQLTRLPITTMSLAGREIVLRVIDPNGITVTTIKTNTSDKDGHFLFRDVGGFNLKGRYKLEASFVETTLLASSHVASNLLVGESAGYAIIVEGRITSNEGLTSHNKTANRIYQQLLARGFEKEKIFYFNHDTTQPGVDAKPIKSEVEKVISGTHTDFQLASLVNGTPAPVYLIMVDHGQKDKFYLNGDTEWITPAELNGWLTTLEAKLTLDVQQKEKRIVILGACYSGSFVPALSKLGRVVISSAASGEESYKGPQEPDGVRVGEFFLESLFKQLKRGNTLGMAFQESVSQTGVFTRSGNRSTNSINPFFDDAMQHPLLDDNGDQKGSHQLTADTYGDGSVANGLFLGTGVSYATNSWLNPAELEEVTQTLYLGPTVDSATLWAKSYDDSQVSSGWIEIRSPSKILTATGGLQQLEVNLERILLDPPVNGRWSVNLTGKFQEAGLYEIYYFLRDKQSGDISPMMRSLVYKQQAANTAPSAFSLLSPANAAKTKTVTVFNWAASSDPNGVTYNLLIATDSTFQNIIYRQEQIQTTATFVDETAKLADLTTYYWKVQAVDSFGEVTDSQEVWSFSTDNTNGVPGIVQGIVMSDMNFSRIAEALVKVNNTQVTTKEDGSFILLTEAGTPSLLGNRAGFADITLPSMAIESGKTTRVNIILHSLTNDIPTALDKAFTTVEETLYTGTLSAADPGGKSLTYSLVSFPTKGSVTITNAATGAFIYTPSHNATGADSFNFKVFNGTVYSNAATMTITITSVNDPPMAINGTVSADKNAVHAGMLSALDVDGDPLTYSIVTQPTNGLIAITNSSTGAFTYTPNLNVTGSDSFTFKVYDGITFSDPAAMIVSVSNHALVGTRFVLDIDGNSQYNALTDGLLMMRYLYGINDNLLTDGVVDVAGTRATSATVRAYLDANRTSLDVDGNGNIDASTDGLLILRYLFGFRGETLTNGAVGSAATRTDAVTISTYINALMPVQ